MTKYLFPLTLLFTACETSEEILEEKMEFRNAPSLVLYLSQYDAEIKLNDFAAIVQICADLKDQPSLALTWTEYPPNGTDNSQVVGFGFSAIATPQLAECYREVMQKLGAKP